MGRTAILEMQNVRAALLVDDDAWIIVLAHDNLVLRLQLDVVLRVQILLRMRTTLVPVLMHETFTAALYVFSTTFLKKLLFRELLASFFCLLVDVF